jgi:hypothetical protein
MNRKERNNEIRRRVLLGETYQAVANDYGLTRERVRQIAADPSRPCRSCGERMEGRRRSYCDACSSCSKCGASLRGHRHGTGLLCSKCKPKGATRPATMRAVERGIYVTLYPESGYQAPGFLVVAGYHPYRLTRHSTIEEAREHRRARGLPVGPKVAA